MIVTINNLLVLHVSTSIGHFQVNVKRHEGFVAYFSYMTNICDVYRIVNARYITSS